jgi:hypothetical protein
MKFFIKEWAKRKKINPRYTWIISKIELVYLSIRFRYDQIKTNSYLRSKWTTINDGMLPIKNVTELIPPSLDLFIYNPTVTLDKDNDLFYFARVTNRSYIPKVDFWQRGQKRDSADFSLDGVCSFKVTKNYELSDFQIVIDPTLIPNFQDPKAISFKDAHLLFGNYVVKEANGSDRTFISKVAFYDTKDQVFEILESPFNKNIEKNWIPFQINNGILSLIYRCKPLTVLEYDFNLKKIEYRILDDKVDLNYHGGSQFVKINEDSYLRIVRYKFQFPKLGLINLSYAIIHDSDLHIKFISKPFMFRKFGFEICNGLIIVGDRLVFAWGEDDLKMFTGDMPIVEFLEWINNDKHSKKSSVNIFSLKQ